MLEQMARTLEDHSAGLLAYYDYPISTGPLEGTNNKIKTMKRQAYGFRDLEFFELKILAILETKYALVGSSSVQCCHRLVSARVSAG
jgi:transposase